MLLTNQQLLEFAKTKEPSSRLDVYCSVTWLAAQTASQLSGKEHRMNGWHAFSNYHGEGLTYTKVSREYAEWCESIDEHNRDNETQTTYQDAIDALEEFIKDEENQIL